MTDSETGETQTAKEAVEKAVNESRKGKFS